MPKKEVSFVIIYHLNLTIIKQFLLILLLFISSIVEGQNLVPNGSFEEYDTCPYQGSQLYFVKPWFSPTEGTPDLYNVCSSNMNPSTIGFVSSQNNLGFIGINVITFWETEYIAVKLNESLIKDVDYCVSFSVNIRKGNELFCSIDKIGCYLSQDSIHQNGFWFLHYLPQIRNTSPIVDTSWAEVFGNYKAQGGEQYIYIGNFDSTNNVQHCNFNDPTMETTYLLIDNVSVVEATECDLLHGIVLPNVLTPNADYINDVIDIPTEIKVNTYIYNRWGTLISEYQGNKIYWDGMAKGQKCTDGVYFMMIEYELNDKRMTKQTFIQLIN
jgi:gliding motility-associated-like protein